MDVSTWKWSHNFLLRTNERSIISPGIDFMSIGGHRLVTEIVLMQDKILWLTVIMKHLFHVSVLARQPQIFVTEQNSFKKMNCTDDLSVCWKFHIPEAFVISEIAIYSGFSIFIKHKCKPQNFTSNLDKSLTYNKRAMLFVIPCMKNMKILLFHITKYCGWQFLKSCFYPHVSHKNLLNNEFFWNL